MQDLIGRTLGQYRVVEQLGKGGMATVYKAFQPSLERYVAVKVLPPYFAHEEGFSERFVREARAVARLDHPHILPIYDFGQENKISYIVMKYVDAGTLKDLASREQMPLMQVIDIVSQTAEALDYAHQQGVIHRDIKPANILMDRGCWVLLTDFGLAKMVEGSQQLTASGVGVGTPAYMAPEQGQGRTIDERADVYSLGIVVYEMLTGRVPYEAETPLAVVLKHVTDPLPLPRAVNPEISEPVELVILKALSKEAEDRYQTPGDMALALQNAAQDAQFLETGAEDWSLEEMSLSSPVAPPDMAPAEEVDEYGSTKAAVIESSPVESVDEPPPVAETVAPAPTTDAKSQRRRARWWIYALAGVLLLALIGGGVWLAVARPWEWTDAGLPSVEEREPSVPSEAGPLVLAVEVRPEADVDVLVAEMEQGLSQAAGQKVALVPVREAAQLPNLLRDGTVQGAIVRTPVWAWLLLDQGLEMEPVLYALPVFSPQLYVRNDGSMNSVDDLWDRRVAIPAPNDYAAILGRAALLDEGLDVESDCEMIYVHDVFSQDAVRESLELLRQGEVDGVLTHNFAIDLVRETVPEIDEQVRGLGEGPSMSYGVLALLYDLPESEAIALIDAALELSPDLLEALTPFTGMIDSAEPLAYPFVDSVEALGIDPWPAAVGASFDGQRGEEPKPPRATDLRVAVIPAAGAVAERNRFSTPVLKSLQRASAELDYELAVGETPDGGNMADTVQAMIDGGHTVIVAVGWPDIEPLWGLAQDHPEITFINFWGHYPQELPNLQSFAYRMEEAGLLAGALAGWATEHGHVAVVGGARVDAVERLIAGFERGLAVSCDGCTFDAPLAGTFDDEALGAEMGRNAVAEGADVVFNAAGGLGSAAIRAAAQEGAWVIGVDWDEYVTTFEQGQVPGAERLLGSVVLRVDRQAVQALTALARGEFTPGNVVSGVRDGGIEFVPGRDVAHPRQAELDAQLKELETMIRAGEVPGR